MGFCGLGEDGEARGGLSLSQVTQLGLSPAFGDAGALCPLWSFAPLLPSLPASCVSASLADVH